tara:strand:- start:3764 stop:4816 length:1053 start_codon:yes stop_codon:yes gene_type:complete
MTIPVILVGYGYSGRVIHGPLIQTAEGLHLAAVVSSAPDKVKNDLPNIEIFRSLDESLAATSDGLVIIANPTESHYPLARQALVAERHVVIEKPFTVSTAEADELIALANTANRKLGVFHNRRWDDDYLCIRNLIEEGRLGRIQLFDAYFDRFRPDVRDRWREQARPGAGALYDLGSHLIDQALQLFGTPDDVYADIGAQRSGPADDYCLLSLRFGDCRATLRCASLVPESSLRYAVHGDNGSFIRYGLDPQERALQMGLRPGDFGWPGIPAQSSTILYKSLAGQVPHKHILSLESGRYDVFYAMTARAIQDDLDPPVTALDARNVIAIIEAARGSAKHGKRLPLPGKLK